MIITVLFVTLYFIAVGVVEGMKFSVKPIPTTYHTWRTLATLVVSLLMWALPHLEWYQAIILLVGADRLGTRVMCLKMVGNFFANITGVFHIRLWKWELNLNHPKAWLDCILIIACYGLLLYL